MKPEPNEELSPLGRELMDALEEVAAHRRGELQLRSREVAVPGRVDVASIRQRLALTQQQFAERFGLALSAIRDWEQGRRQPDRAARVLLQVIDKESEAVERALASA